MTSLFMRPDFRFVQSTDTEIKIASIAWGWQLGFTVLTAAKAASQATRIWRRKGRVTAYVLMVWAEILSNVAWGTLAWLYLNAIIPPSFGLFLGIVVLWCIELQCLIQIIVNRLSLLLYNDRQKLCIKWGCFIYIALLNVSVFIIWIPAQLQYQPWHNINVVWDRVEKGLFLIVDVGLNIYFVYLVKTRLISSGMTKYTPLFRFNVCMIVVSVSMDVLILAMMAMPNPLMYMQFHPVAYMIKLNIEMSMAHLIGKIAKSNDSSNFQYGFPYNGGEDGSSAGFHRTGSTRSPQASSRYDIQRSACTTTTTKSFGSTMSDVEAWPYEGYPAKAVSDINTFELTKTKEFNGHRRPEVTHNWRKTQSDDTVVWSDTDFSGISRATDATAVADAWRASRGTFPEGSKGTYQPWI